MLQASGNFSDVKSLRLIFSSADLTEMGGGIVKFAAYERFPGVQSQLHYEMDKCFREADIEIAFPQTDMQIRSMPAPAEER